MRDKIEKSVDITKKYSDEDRAYLKKILGRIEDAKEQRNQVYVEFGNRTYVQRYNDNKKKAISVLPIKKNVDDVLITTGSVEQKLDAVLSAVNRLDLVPHVRAFDKNDNVLSEAGRIMDDALFYTATIDGDAEKKLARQREMLIQGEVFVKEVWCERWKKTKELNKAFIGQFEGLDWTEKLEQAESYPSRNVLYGPDVYLGDITKYYMKDQPFVPYVKLDNYDVVKSVFGKWEMWEEVERRCKGGPTDLAAVQGENPYDLRWTLNEVKKDQVEIIFYEDRPNNEYNVIIQGVMMLPAGFPLSAVSPNGEYTIEKQVFKNTDANFAYGKGFIETSEKLADLLDEMWKLAVLKTRKSFMPAWINTGRKYISPRVLQSGKITMGIPSNVLAPLGDMSEGVTQSEFQMIQKLQETIDRNTVSAQFTGQQGKAGTTATEVLELRKQAEMTLGLMIFACTLLEEKIGYLRLWNILENWFKPIDKVILGDKPVNKYRKITVEATIPQEGLGERRTVLIDQKLPTPKEIRRRERDMAKEYGFPIELVFANPDEMKKAIKKWYIVVTSSEKDTSELSKLSFREELTDLMTTMNFGSMPNVDEIENTYSRIYGKDKAKAFVKGPKAQMGPAGMDPNQVQGRPNVAGVPALNNVKR